MILIVTPDSRKREAITELCTKSGIEANSVPNAITALDELDRRSAPEAIIFDNSCLRLTPQLDMALFRSSIKRYYPGLLPIIVFDMQAWHGKAPHGGEKFMIYPFSSLEFLKALQSVSAT